MADGFRRRLVETEGVVATQEGAIGTSLVIRQLTMEVPEKVKDLIANVKKTWTIGDKELESATEKARVLKQLASGFWYRWAWPKDEPDYEWLEARSAWSREVRSKLSHASEGLDSPLLLAQAAERYRVWESEGCPRPKPKKVWDSFYWNAWRLVKDRRPPPTEAVWEDSFVVEYAVAWAAKQKEPAIIWYSSTTVGEKIAAKGRFPLFGEGTDASECKKKVIVASIRTQGTGKNLQHYCRNLIIELPPNGTTVEQLVGRTHRPGNEADEVEVDWLGHTPELEDAMAKAIDDAEYMEKTTGQRQKLLYATKTSNKEQGAKS